MKVRRIAVAEVAVLLERFVDDALQLFGNGGVDAPWLGGCFVKNRIEDRSGRVTAERKQTRSHFIKDDPEREQVRARVERLAEHLFRRHIRNGPEGAPRARELCGVDDLRALRGRPIHGRFASRERNLGQAKIENLGMTSLRYKNVGRLDIPMDDALRVRRIKRISNFKGEIEKLIQFERVAGDRCFSVTPSRNSMTM